MKSNTCETHRLAEFLDGSLNDHDSNELMKHLDRCDLCGEELARLAAAPERWKDVKTHLSSKAIRETDHRNQANDSETQARDNLPFTIRQVIQMLDPTDTPSSMGRLGGYEIQGVVGNGAMGVVLKAVDQTLDRVVALKVMNPTLAACGTARHRFAREAKAAAGVLHPNVIAIHGVSTDRELPFLVMPYVTGISLQQRIARQGPLAFPEILRVGSQIAAGLAAAHQKGLIHRDIKPSNIMLDEGVETAVITDFGLARTIDDATMTRSGAITGTPEYMSPEQARGDTVDCSSDVFSLGSVLYALCSGRQPFRATTPFGVLRKITDEQPANIRELNPDIPTWVCNLIERMHSKSPDKRPTAAEVFGSLEAGLAHVYQPDRIPLPDKLTQPNEAGNSVSSRTFWIGAITMVTCVFIAITLAAMQPGNFFGDRVAKEETPRQQQNEVKDKHTVFKTENLKFPKMGVKGNLVIDINRGFVEVTGHEKNDVVIEVLLPPNFEKAGRNDDELQKVFAPDYDLTRDENKNQIKLDTYNQDYVLNLRIKVPHATNLSLDTYMDGFLQVKDVTGVIETRTQHSDIRLKNIAGSATSYSYNGNVTVQFTDVAPNARLDFESYNGNIDLTLPPSIAASTAVSTGIGSFRSAFKISAAEGYERPDSILSKVKSNADEYQFGKINGGGVPIRIESKKGEIKIRRAKEMKPQY